MQTITATITIEYEYKKDTYGLGESAQTVRDAAKTDEALLTGDPFFRTVEEFMDWLEDNTLVVKRSIEVRAND